MKRLTKILLSIMMVLTLCSCKKEETYNGPQIELKLFYYDYCMRCHSFMDHAIPALEKEFGEYITIHCYDIEAGEHVVDMYAEVVSRLENFNPDFAGYAPFIVFEGLFAKIGYDDGTVQYYIDDVKRAVKGEKLDTFLDVTNDRFFFKES